MHTNRFTKTQYVLFAIFLIVLGFTWNPIYKQFKALPPNMVQATFIKQTPIILDARVNHMRGSWVSANKIHEPAAVELVYSELESRLKAKDEVLLIDIGANTGSFALLPVLSDKIKVVAFEPNIAVADVLRANVALNKIDNNVTILPIGISDRNTVLKLHIPSTSSTGLATFGSNVLRFNAEAGSTLAAIVTPLDEILPTVVDKDKKVDLIKIDTEGWEYYVLLGAKQTLRDNQPHLLIEYVPVNMKQAGVKPQELIQLLADLNYACDLKDENLYCKPGAS